MNDRSLATAVTVVLFAAVVFGGALPLCSIFGPAPASSPPHTSVSSTCTVTGCSARSPTQTICFQETLIAAWRGLDGFADLASIRAWLYRIATNRCLNVIRNTKRLVATTPVSPFHPSDPSRRSKMTWL